MGLAFIHWMRLGPVRGLACQLARFDNRILAHSRNGAPEPNARVGDLLALRPGNPPYKGKTARATSREDAELLRSVFQPLDGQFLAMHRLYAGAILQGNHRRYELLRRAGDPESKISFDTPIFINNFTVETREQVRRPRRSRRSTARRRDPHGMGLPDRLARPWCRASR
ncbi:hypothetical protein AB0L00_09020 [Actinoallomurus sp. NPDC052308]|uniref:hypothetical protein n=1 Tax=Actinoallomurus sp. NPDC052308 TaxID=3155530 RepID=UPI003432584B